jgi:zinc protease
MSIEGGRRLESYDPAKAGITSLMASLMNESTSKRSAEDMAKALEMLGSSVSVYSSENGINVNIRSLEKNIDKTLALAEEILFSPGFREDEFTRLRNEQIESIQDQNTQPSAIARKVYNKLIYGANNIQGISSMGTVETVENIQLDDVRQYYENYFSPSTANIVIVGSLTMDEMLPKLSMFEKWRGPEVKIPAEMDIPETGETTIYLVDKEKSAQSEIRIGKYTGLTYDAVGEYYKASLMNYPLGGNFNSRINLNLREDKGYTYGARSRFSGNKYDGTYTASAGVKIDATAESVQEFMKEISNYHRNGITEDELTFMKSSIGQREALSYESPFQKASFLRRIITYNLDEEFTTKQNNILQQMTKKDIDLLAAKYLNPDNMNIVVVGDKKVVKEKLMDLGYPLKELDKEGNEIITPQEQKLDSNK